MKRSWQNLCVLAALQCSMLQPAWAQVAAGEWRGETDRTRLPMAPPRYHGTLAKTISSSSPEAFPARPRAPVGAPNILLILTDDVGYAASSTFGGPVSTPTLSALASTGLRYNRFHTAALCSPTRAALLTGRNPHRVGFGTISEQASGYPGYTTILPNSAATMGQVLGLNGYSTAWFGKNHNTPPWEITPVGPFSRWPSPGLGFDHFYGFMGGETNQFSPELYRNTTPIEIGLRTDRLLEEDLADNAIAWIRQQRRYQPDQPFFLYYATGAAHSPNQAPKEWIDKYRGRFDAGWDELRVRIFESEKRAGAIPKDARLSPRPAAIAAWTSLSAEERKVAARLMEAAAGQLSYTDAQIGRLIDTLKQEGVFDNTLIIYIQGDNGQSPGGQKLGTLSDIGLVNGNSPRTAYAVAHLDEVGTSPYLQSDIPSGFAWAMGTPFQWYKGIGSHLGGIRNNLVVSWPGHVKAVNRVRTQFHFVTDIAATVYEAANVPAPTSVNGVEQMPLDGISMLYTLGNPEAADRRTEQVFEMNGNRAIYRDGWLAATTPSEDALRDLTADHWELYDLRSDYSQSIDLAQKEPSRLATLRARFDELAWEGSIYPVSAGGLGRFTNANRPKALPNSAKWIFDGDQQRYSELAFPDVKNRSWQATVRIDVQESAASGTLVTQGGRLGGWGFRLDSGRPQFIYSNGPQEGDTTVVTAERPLAHGRHTLNLRVDYAAKGIGGGASVTVLDGQRVVASGTIPRTVGLFFQEGASIGRDYGTTLTDAQVLPDRFTGSIESVEFSSVDK